MILTTPTPLAAAAVATAGREDAPFVFNTLTQAFRNDPVLRWMYPSQSDYLANYPRFAEAFGGAALDSRTASRVGQGAALWLPPMAGPDEDGLAAHLQETLEPRKAETLFAIFARLDAAHPTEPHWHLPLMGVNPNWQGLGLGSALLKHGIKRAAEDGLPVYLEATSDDSRRLYERHGFNLMDTIHEGDCPPVYPMILAILPLPINCDFGIDPYSRVSPLECLFY